MVRCRIAVLMFFVLLWCGFAVAQEQHLLTNYQPVNDMDVESSSSGMAGMTSTATTSTTNYYTTVDVALADNHYNCYATYARNCWAQTTPGSVVQISSGVDGYTIGVASNHTTYNLPPADTNDGQSSWIGLSGLSGINSVAVASRYAVYGLGTGTCAGSYVIKKANSSLTGWTTLNGCLAQLSAAPGIIGGVTGNVGYFSTDDGVTWQITPGSWQKLVVTSNTTALGLSSGYAYSIDLTSGAFTYLGIGGATDITGSLDSVWILKTSTPFYRDLSISGSTFQQMAGAVTKIAGRGFFVFGLVGSQPYHFVAAAPNVRTTTQGDYSAGCLSFPNGCPTGAIHTATATTVWSQAGVAGQYGQSYSVSGTPQTQLYATANDTSFLCDVLFGTPSGSGVCAVQSKGAVDCNKMGNLFAAAMASLGGFWHKHVLIAEVRSKWTGGPGADCIGVGTTQSCYWPTTAWCANGTPSPYNPPGVQWWTDEVLGSRGMAYFDTVAECFALYSGSPWHCVSVQQTIPTLGANIPKSVCTQEGYNAP